MAANLKPDRPEGREQNVNLERLHRLALGGGQEQRPSRHFPQSKRTSCLQTVQIIVERLGLAERRVLMGESFPDNR